MAKVSLFIALPSEQSMIIPGLELCDRLQRKFSSKDHLHPTLQTLDQRILLFLSETEDFEGQSVTKDQW